MLSFFQQKRKQKENTMGTACICYKQQKQSALLVPLDPSQLSAQSEKGKGAAARERNRFADIQNEVNGEQDLSEMDLNMMNNELSRYLIEFQLKNGAITNRFTQRLLNENSRLEENTGNVKIGQENKENGGQSNKQNELYLPLTGQNIDEDVEQSFVSENEEGRTHNKSCLLSLSSHILHDSLFTERAQKKQEFYRAFSNIGSITLSKWPDINRLNLSFTLDDINTLKNSHFDSKFITALKCLHQYWESHFIHLITYCQEGLKVYMNGDMKLFPLPFMEGNLSLQDVYTVITSVQDLDLAETIYFLTGWMPQHIYLSDIKNFAGILERLSNNLTEGNTLITFSRDTKYGREYASLTNIDFETGLISLNSCNLKSTIPDVLLEHKDPQTNEISIQFQHFIELYDVINLNWNPFIYDLNQSCEGIIQEKKQIKKFLLVIPPSSQDLEIRLFFERHIDYSKLNKLGITINLYEYEGFDDTSQMQPIRTIESNEPIYSDVFIFEYCKEKTQYLLTVSINESQQLEAELFFTLTLYSFAEMKFKELQRKPCLIDARITTDISEKNIGYGINSPYFNKNLQFSVATEIGKQLQINITASKNLVYEICLIPDPQEEGNLTKLKLEDIINNSQISGERRGRGSFFVKAAFKHYLLMINTYSCVQEYIDVELRLYGKEESALQQHTLKIKQIVESYKPLYTQQVKWLPTHSGPRKRLKSNSVNAFQPAQTFTQFFKNPVTDKKLVKGTYQFFIKSQTFRQYFDSVESNEDKNACEPPALSMALFLTSQDKKSYKIIVDDAFYVPFGVGFWTCSIDLQQGNYRFVFPKMDKGFSKGLFGIIKN